MFLSTGPPYDTLQAVIGTRGGGSARSLLKRGGITYREIPLRKDGNPDYAAIGAGITEQTRMAIIQRSRGYSWRPSFTIAQIAQAVQEIKQSNPHCIVFVDNCYGEFVEFYEPLEAGADLIAGSLIKNPGGTLAVSGGYIAGSERLVGMCAEILTAPSLGGKIGPTFGLTRQLLHGLFLAPPRCGRGVIRGGNFGSPDLFRTWLRGQPAARCAAHRYCPGHSV